MSEKLWITTLKYKQIEFYWTITLRNWTKIVHMIFYSRYENVDIDTIINIQFHKINIRDYTYLVKQSKKVLI